MHAKNEKAVVAPKSGYSSISKVVQILRCFSINRPMLTVQQIAKRVNMPTSSLYRYLQTMVGVGFLSHHPEENRFSVGTYAIELGGLALMQYEVRQVSLRDLNELSNRLQMNVNLSILSDCDIVHLAFVLKHFTTPWQDAIGRRTPAYLTAMGQMMLAYQPYDKVCELIHSHHAINPVNYPLPDFEQLEKQLILAKKKQCAILHSKYPTSEILCLAFPIRKRGGDVCAAISANWYKELGDTNTADIQRIRDLASHTAAEISYKMGYTGSAYASIMEG